MHATTTRTQYLTSALEACVGAPTAIVPFDSLHDPRAFAFALRERLVDAWPGLGDVLATPTDDAIGEALFGADGWAAQRASATTKGAPVKLELGDPARAGRRRAAAAAMHGASPASAAVAEGSVEMASSTNDRTIRQPYAGLSLGLQRLSKAFEGALAATASGGPDDAYGDSSSRGERHPLAPRPASLAAHVLSEARVGGHVRVLLFWTTSPESFGAQESSVLESIFYHHPHAEVAVFSNTLPADFFESFALAGYALSIEPYDLRGTLAKHWPADFDFFSAEKSSDFFYSHATDALRFALLYERGGVYMDFDVVLANPLDNLPERWLAFQYSKEHPPKRTNWAARLFDPEDASTWVVNGAMMAFPPRDPFMARALETVPEVWDPEVWYSIGPQHLTNLLLDRVNARRVPEWEGVAILPMEAVAPVPWYLAEACTRRSVGGPDDCPVLWLQVKHHARAFHLYNKITSAASIEEGSLYHHLLTAFRLPAPAPGVLGRRGDARLR